MIDNIDKNICTGCNGCLNICPKKCVYMKSDDKGFWYPEVNYEQCVKCGLCKKVCPALHEVIVKNNYIEPKIYASWSLDEEVRFNSTSGGVFTELAKYIISRGGYVAAAKYNDKHLVEHEIIDNIKDLNMLRQSKYIQSDIGVIYQKIKEKLSKGNLVAFCGAPCQVAGLLKYLGKDYSNLMCFDFVCRGTNSPKAYIKYLEMLEGKYKSKVKKVWFKNKTYGWNRFSTRIDFENGKVYLKDRYTDLFMRGYIEENLYMRDCCFNCKYMEFPRKSDITLADFWGIGTKDRSLDTDKGTSLVMINTDKGNDIFNIIKEQIYAKEMSIQDALPNNRCILEPAVKNPKSDEFLKMLDNNSFDECFRVNVQVQKRKRLKLKVYRIGSRMKRKLYNMLIFLK